MPRVTTYIKVMNRPVLLIKHISTDVNTNIEFLPCNDAVIEAGGLLPSRFVAVERDCEDVH